MASTSCRVTSNCSFRRCNSARTLFFGWDSVHGCYQMCLWGSVFILVDQRSQTQSLSWLCRQLGGDQIGFSFWRQRQQSWGKRAALNAAITAQIKAVVQKHRGFYGSPRIHQELRAFGLQVGRHLVGWDTPRVQVRALTRKVRRPFPWTGKGTAGVIWLCGSICTAAESMAGGWISTCLPHR